MKIYDSITETIGHTPLVRAPHYSKGLNADIVFKMESFNPMSSVKDRIAKAMIESALAKGEITHETTLIEPTSGNTGIGLAFICAAKQIPLVLTMPETMSLERRKILQALGAKLVLTEGAKGMKGAIAKAEELHANDAKSKLVGQFVNPANPAVHKSTTAVEIWNDTEGKIDCFVAGVGTGGTLTGCGEFFRQKNAHIKLVAVEPSDSPVITQTLEKREIKPGPHKIQGIGAGFIPEVFNLSLVDEVIQVTNDQAMQTARLLCKNDGLMVGISSGAAAYAAKELAKRTEFKGKRIVAMLASHGERYLSTALYDFEGTSSPVI